MEQFKIELHAHTVYNSGCSQMDAATMVRMYLEKGYAGIMICDHFTRHEILGRKQAGVSDLYTYLTGYRAVLEEGQRQGLKVYRGAEVRFDENENDYLLINYPDSLLEDADTVFRAGLEGFYKMRQDTDALLIQAHPGRHVCTFADHRYLDGIEVYNMHPGWNSHNELALEFANRWPNLIRTAGSDCHAPDHVGHGGICTQTLPENEAQLAALLRSGKYELIGHL